jgi:hypothetical protein
MYAPIKEDVYIRQPVGFDDGTTNVCHMHRCMYGLKQSPREFNELLRDWLVSQGWLQLISDPCIYIFEANGVFAMIALYVIEIEIVYNMYRMRRFFTKSRMRRLLSLGPPNSLYVDDIQVAYWRAITQHGGWHSPH